MANQKLENICKLFAIDLFPIAVDVRGLRPDKLCFPRFLSVNLLFLFCDITVQA